MSAGIEIRTPQGDLIIDENYQNVVFDRKIKIDELPHEIVSENLPNDNIMRKEYYKIYYKKYTFSPKSNDLVFAISANDSLLQHYFYSETGKRTIDLYMFQGVMHVTNWFDEAEYIPAPDLSEFYIYVFKKKTISSKNYGLQVFNENGECVFDSSQKYMKILQYGQTEGAAPPRAEGTAIVIPPLYGYVPCGAKGQFLQDPNTHNVRLRLHFFEGLTSLGVYNVYLPVFMIDTTGL